MDQWVCDMCNAINTAETFPCPCGYPAAHPRSPQTNKVADEVYEGGEEGRDQQERARRVAPRGSRWKRPPPVVQEMAQEVQELNEQDHDGHGSHGHGKAACLAENCNWQCELCLLPSEGPPCVCCGFDPAQQALPERSEAEEEETLLRDMQLAAAAKIVASPEGSAVGPFQLHGGGFRFRVWAPNALKVEVVGDFNNWGLEDAVELSPESDNQHWRGTVKNAAFGQRYRFRVTFLRDKVATAPTSPSARNTVLARLRAAAGKITTAWRADPYAPVLEPDAQLRKVYNSVLFDHTAFKWTDEDFVAPLVENCVFYEIHVACFATHKSTDGDHECGTFRSTADRLDYLRELGINGICLMPVMHDAHPNEEEDFYCWGYDPISFFAIHPAFGTPDDLKYLVNEAHKRGMAVIYDFVCNHVHKRSILQWWDGTNQYFFEDPTDWGPRPRFSDSRVQNHIIDAVLSLFRDYHFDGIRMDSTSNIRGASADIPGGWQLLQRINDAVHERFPSAYTICEDLYDDDRLTSGGACFDMQWGQGYFKALYNAATAVSDPARDIAAIASWMVHVHPGPAGGRVLYTENHDTIPADRERRVPVAIVRGLPGVNPQENFFAIKRSTLIACVMMCSPGVPMIMQGQEFLELFSPEWPHGPTVDWSNLLRMNGVFRLYQDMIRLRTNVDGNTLGLTSPFVRTHHVNKHAVVLAIHRWERGGEGDDVICLFNFSNVNYSTYRVGVPREGPWTLRLSTDQKKYLDRFRSTDVAVATMVEANNAQPRDGYPFSAAFGLPKYSCVIYSQDGQAQLVFRIRKETSYGEQVCIVGSDKALGEWKEPVALFTESADAQYPWWQSRPVAVVARKHLEFKVVLRKPNGTLVWENRDNRVLTPARGRHVLLLVPEL